MLRFCALAASVLSLLATAPRAEAAVLPVYGEMTFEIGAVDPFSLTGSFSVDIATTAGGMITDISLPGSPFAVTALSLDVNEATAGPIAGLLLTAHNLPGAIPRLTPGTIWGTMKMSGVARLCLFADCSAPLVPANLSIPLSVVGGNYEVTYVTSLVNMTVGGHAWATITVTAMGGGYVHGPGSATSTAAQSGGMIQLVSPIFIQTNIPALSDVGARGVMTLHIIPEPGTLLLCSLGAVGLVAVGRVRRRRQIDRGVCSAG